MGCNCGTQTAMSYIEGENYGIYGFLPTEGEYVPNLGDLITSALIIGGIASIAYLAVKSAEKKKSASKRPRWMGRKYVSG